MQQESVAIIVFFVRIRRGENIENMESSLHPSIKHLGRDSNPPAACTAGGHSTKELSRQLIAASSKPLHEERETYASKVDTGEGLNSRRKTAQKPGHLLGRPVSTP
jgi:hypothetical protein